MQPLKNRMQHWSRHLYKKFSLRNYRTFHWKMFLNVRNCPEFFDRFGKKNLIISQEFQSLVIMQIKIVGAVVINMLIQSIFCEPTNFRWFKKLSIPVVTTCQSFRHSCFPGCVFSVVATWAACRPSHLLSWGASKIFGPMQVKFLSYGKKAIRSSFLDLNFKSWTVAFQRPTKT